VIVWDKVKVPFTIDVGDVNNRFLTEIRRQMSNLKTDDFRTPAQAASWVYSTKITASYQEAVQWLDKSISIRETFGSLNTKARILADMGKTAEAIATAEKAIQVGKAATPAANTAALEKLLAEWKVKK
jgi:tetratricopeptide (TPR) repeat protein